MQIMLRNAGGSAKCTGARSHAEMATGERVFTWGTVIHRPGSTDHMHAKR